MLWRFDEAADQRDARRFHQWIVPGVASADWPRFGIRGLRRRAVQRSPMPDSVPPETWRIHVHDLMPLPDIWRERSHWAGKGNHFIVSERLRDAMRLPPHAAQFPPVLVLADDPAAQPMNYALMRVLASAPAMDRKRSEFAIQPYKPNPIITNYLTPPEEELRINRFEVDPGLSPPADLFWVDEATSLLLATEALADRVQAAGCVGVVFDTNYAADAGGGRRNHICRLPGGDVAQRRAHARSPIGLRPARRPGGPPVFAPTIGLPAELTAIEMFVGRRLPSDYAQFLVASSGATPENYTGPLQERPECVLRVNRFVRSEPGVDWLREEGPWPNDWLVTGDDNCGNYWALDLSRAPSPLLYYDHDYGDARVVAPDLTAFVRASQPR